jgi:nucleotide-binding universal stress UspA family protein
MKRFSNILFVVTSDDDVSAAFTKAIELAKNNQARITVAGVIDATDEAKTELEAGRSPLLDSIVLSKTEQLRALVDSAVSANLQCEIKVLLGIGFIEIIREVMNFQRDLLIKSIDSADSIADKILGSMDMKLLRKCPCPVWLIKPTQQKGFRKIMVGLDYQPENAEIEELNRQLLEMSSSLALAEFCELHIIHAWSLAHENFYRSPRSGFTSNEFEELLSEEEEIRRKWLTEIVDKYCLTKSKEAKDYLRPKLHLKKGNARDVVLNCASELAAELVVVGTVCRTGIPGLVIGNTAEEILNRVDSSILAVKPEGFVSPVQ